MKLKQYILEQANLTTQSKLQRAIDLGCISSYKNFVPDTNPAKPVEIEFMGQTLWAITGKGAQTKTPFYFLAEPMVMVNVDEASKNPQDRDPEKAVSKKWVCADLETDDEQKTYLSELKGKGWSLQTPTRKDLDDNVYLGFDLVNSTKYTPEGYKEVDSKDFTFNEVLPYVKYFSNLSKANGSVKVYKRNTQKSTFKAEEGGDCRENIKILMDLFTGKRSEDDEFIKRIKNTVQNCVNQRNFTLRPDIRKDLQKLSEINPYDPKYGKFKLVLPQRESLTKLVNKVLRETKETKNNKLIENKLIESRLKFIIENQQSFNKLPVSKKVRTGFNFITEINKIKSLGFLNENLTDIFKQMFGKSLDSMVGNVSEPLLNSVFIKVSLPEDVKKQVLDKIKEDSNELINNIDSCDNLANFLSEKVSDVLAENMVQKNLFNSDIVNSTISDSLKDEAFKQRLAEKIKLQVCEMFDKFSTNAQNLVTKLTS